MSRFLSFLIVDDRNMHSASHLLVTFLIQRLQTHFIFFTFFAFKKFFFNLFTYMIRAWWIDYGQVSVLLICATQIVKCIVGQKLM